MMCCGDLLHFRYVCDVRCNDKMEGLDFHRIPGFFQLLINDDTYHVIHDV